MCQCVRTRSADSDLQMDLKAAKLSFGYYYNRAASVAVTYSIYLLIVNGKTILISILFRIHWNEFVGLGTQVARIRGIGSTCESSSPNSTTNGALLPDVTSYIFVFVSSIAIIFNCLITTEFTRITLVLAALISK